MRNNFLLTILNFSKWFFKKLIGCLLSIVVFYTLLKFNIFFLEQFITDMDMLEQAKISAQSLQELIYCIIEMWNNPNLFSIAPFITSLFNNVEILVKFIYVFFDWLIEKGIKLFIFVLDYVLIWVLTFLEKWFPYFFGNSILTLYIYLFDIFIIHYLNLYLEDITDIIFLTFCWYMMYYHYKKNYLNNHNKKVNF